MWSFLKQNDSYTLFSICILGQAASVLAGSGRFWAMLCLFRTSIVSMYMKGPDLSSTLTGRRSVRMSRKAASICETRSSICGMARRAKRQDPILISSATACAVMGSSGAFAGFSAFGGSWPDETKFHSSDSEEGEEEEEEARGALSPQLTDNVDDNDDETEGGHGSMVDPIRLGCMKVLWGVFSAWTSRMHGERR